MKESLQQLTEQRLQQTLSPMQVQYARALEMTNLEFDEEVRRVLDDNPALEEDTSADYLPKGDNGESGAEFTETAEQMQLADYRSDEEIPSYRLSASNRSADDPVFDPLANQSDAVTLADSLTAQLAMLDLDEQQRQLTAYVVGNIDRNGYLTRTVDEMIDDIMFATGMMVAREAMQQALAIVQQQLDPPGVGAFDLRQSLLLQLRRRDSAPDVDDALMIVRDYFDLFANKHYDSLIDEAELTQERLRAALDAIRTLNPKPGAAFESAPGEDRLRRIVPDFEVEVEGTQLTVNMVSGQQQLRIAESFDLDDSQLARRDDRRRGVDEAYAFIRRKRDEASDFIQAATMRRQTLMRVMGAIASLQRPFLITGDPLKLQPMILKDVAAITGDDLSVISRATAGKYVQTGSGVYPLKFFFNERPKDDLDASAHEILDAVRQIVEGEDSKHPLSDQAISESLAARGYDIARRTVTKYRERLGIPVARLRREL